LFTPDPARVKPLARWYRISRRWSGHACFDGAIYQGSWHYGELDAAKMLGDDNLKSGPWDGVS
jgi:hypothetical protein